MLTTSDVTYRYPESEVMRFPDMDLQQSSAALLHGASGSGKTTMLHILAGLRSGATGQVILDGADVLSLSTADMDRYRGKHIGVVFQEAYFLQSLTVRDNLMLSPFSASPSKAQQIADRLMIGHLLDRYPHQLSTGQQQRVSIARAVMCSPKLILADEPTSNLDNKNCSEVIKLLIEEANQSGAVLVIATHDDRLKSEVSNHIILDELP